MKPGFKRFLQSWMINTLAVLLAVKILPGIHFPSDSLLAPFVTSLMLGILNAFIRPIMMLLALPLLIFTLGLFMLVINAAVLMLVSWFLPGFFHVDSFGWALLGALIIGITSLLLNSLTGASRSKVEFRGSKRPPDSDKGGDGPVIDV